MVCQPTPASSLASSELALVWSSVLSGPDQPRTLSSPAWAPKPTECQPTACVCLVGGVVTVCWPYAVATTYLKNIKHCCAFLLVLLFICHFGCLVLFVWVRSLAVLLSLATPSRDQQSCLALGLAGTSGVLPYPAWSGVFFIFVTFAWRQAVFPVASRMKTIVFWKDVEKRQTSESEEKASVAEVSPRTAPRGRSDPSY